MSFTSKTQLPNHAKYPLKKYEIAFMFAHKVDGVIVPIQLLYTKEGIEETLQNGSNDSDVIVLAAGIITDSPFYEAYTVRNADIVNQEKMHKSETGHASITETKRLRNIVIAGLGFIDISLIQIGSLDLTNLFYTNQYLKQKDSKSTEFEVVYTLYSPEPDYFNTSSNSSGNTISTLVNSTMSTETSQDRHFKILDNVKRWEYVEGNRKLIHLLKVCIT